MIYLVSYDLNKPEKNYERIISAIKTYEGYCPILKSQWLIYSKKSAYEVASHLINYVDDNDYLFVCEVKDNLAGQFTDEVQNWLKQSGVL